MNLYIHIHYRLICIHTFIYTYKYSLAKMKIRRLPQLASCQYMPLVVCLTQAGDSKIAPDVTMVECNNCHGCGGVCQDHGCGGVCQDHGCGGVCQDHGCGGMLVPAMVWYWWSAGSSHVIRRPKDTVGPAEQNLNFPYLLKIKRSHEQTEPHYENVAL